MTLIKLCNILHITEVKVIGMHTPQATSMGYSKVRPETRLESPYESQSLLRTLQGWTRPDSKAGLTVQRDEWLTTTNQVASLGR